MNTKRKRKLFTLLGAVCGVAIAVALIAYAVRGNLDHFYTPTQLSEEKPPLQQRIKVGGLVKEGSVIRSQEELKVEFLVTDKVSDMRVIYQGILPDLFREGQGIVAHGVYTGPDFLAADKVVAKHDEKYMPPEAAEALLKGEKLQKQHTNEYQSESKQEY